MNQKNFFENESNVDFTAAKIARSSDRRPSHEAAERLVKDGRLKGARLAAYEAAKFLCSDGGDATANEIARRGQVMASCREETIRKRVHELTLRDFAGIDEQLLEIAGERPCKITGENVTTYRLKGEDIVEVKHK